MSMIDGLDEAPRALGWATRFKARIVGASLDLLAKCPDRDVGEISRSFWLLVLVAAYQCAVFASLAHILFGEPGVIHWEFIALALLPAMLVAVLEVALVIVPSYLSSGLATLEQSGLVAPGKWGRRLRNALAITLRLAFALTCAQLGSIAITMPLLGKDTFAALEQTYRERNADLFQAASARHDALLRRTTEEAAGLNTEALRLKHEEEKWRQASLDPTASDPELVALLARIAQLRADKTTAEAELASAQKFANDELLGRKATPNNSGQVGYGPVRRGADEAVQNATDKRDTVARDLAEAENRLPPLREKLASTLAGRTRDAEARLAEVTHEREALDAQVATVGARLRQLTDDRERLIREAVEQDPNHVAKQDGMLARAHAIRTLVESDWTALLLVGIFDCFLFFLEVGVLLSKALAPPTFYSSLLAYEHLISNHNLVQEIARALNEPVPQSAPVIEGDAAAAAAALPSDAEPQPAVADVAETLATHDASSESVDVPTKRGRGRPRRSGGPSPTTEPFPATEVEAQAAREDAMPTAFDPEPIAAGVAVLARLRARSNRNEHPEDASAPVARTGL